MHKCMHAQRHRLMHGCIIYKGNSLKSLSREVVTSAALFTRLMPRCTQERVNQVRGCTRRPELLLKYIIPSPPRNRNEATPSNGGPHKDEGRPFTRYIGTLFTIRVRMTMVKVELKLIALQ